MRFAAHHLSRFSKLFLLLTFGIVAIVTVFNFLLPNPQSSTPPQQIREAPQATSATTPPYHVNTNLGKDQNTRAQVLLFDLSSALICQLAGINMINPSQGCVGIDPITNKLGYVTQTNPNASVQVGGVAIFASDMIGMMYTQPISSGDYIKYMASNFGVTKRSYAQVDQGVGFTTLSPIQGMWTKFRNLAYIALVVVFVLIGLGIMLRVKIDPKVVMSVQNQLPKVVVILVMITFSYAIAGLFVDSMWVTTYMGINLLTEEQECSDNALSSTVTTVATRGILDNPIAYTTNLLGDEGGCFGPFDGISGLSAEIGRTAGDVVGRIVLEATGLNANLGDCGGSSWAGFFAKITDGDCYKQAFFGVIKYFIAILVTLIVLIAILIALFRLWFMLLRSFVYVILGTILGPFYILAGIKPQSTLGTGNWLRFMLSHLLTFPVAAFVLILARIFALNDGLNDPTASRTFIPPLVGNPNSMDNFGVLIAFGMILITPEILNMLRDALKSQPNKYATPAIVGGVGKGVRPISAGTGYTMDRLWRPANLAAGQSAGKLRTAIGGSPTSTGFRKRFIQPIVGGIKDVGGKG